MLNAIALQLMNYLLRGPMLDPEQIEAGTNIPQSAALPEQVWLLRLVPRTLLHSGLILAIVLAVRGLPLSVANDHRLSHSSRRAQPCCLALCRHSRALLPGAVDDSERRFAGLAGAVEVTGVHHRMIEGLSGGYGFSGIVAALFGNLHPLGAIPASFFFGVTARRRGQDAAHHAGTQFAGHHAQRAGRALCRGERNFCTQTVTAAGLCRFRRRSPAEPTVHLGEEVVGD